MGRRSEWTEEKIRRMREEGYGKGTLDAYRPWIRAEKTNSLGRARRIWSHKTSRTHHLLSDVENSLFLALEWQTNVIDIREQYPLDRETTLEIAHQLGIRHPYYPGTDVPTVMTVDLLVTKQHGREKSLEAFNAKRDEEAEDERSLLKLEIQRSYFENMDIPHHIVYHSQIPARKVANIDWIRSAILKEGEVEPSVGYFADLSSRMTSELLQFSDDRFTLAAYCSDFDRRYGCRQGCGLRVARMLMHSRLLKPNLASPNLASEPLSEFVVYAQHATLRAIGGE